MDEYAFQFTGLLSQRSVEHDSPLADETRSMHFPARAGLPGKQLAAMGSESSRKRDFNRLSFNFRRHDGETSCYRATRSIYEAGAGSEFDSATFFAPSSSRRST